MHQKGENSVKKEEKKEKPKKGTYGKSWKKEGQWRGEEVKKKYSQRYFLFQMFITEERYKKKSQIKRCTRDFQNI